MTDHSGTGHERTLLKAENEMLRQEIRVSREAAEITAKLVVEQFSKADAIRERLEHAKEQAESALRENKGFFDNAPFGIIFTHNRHILRCNRAFSDIFAFEGDTAVGQPGRVLCPSDEAYAEIDRLAGPLLAQGQPFEHEMLMLRQNGELFWANLKAYVADPRDPSLGTVWLVQDRTAFKSAEAEIKRSAEEMTAIFEASSFGIAFIKNRIMVKANHKLEDIFGYAIGELTGLGTRCWYPDESSYQSVGEAYRELESGQTHRRELQMRRKDGSLFWARLSGVALSGDASRGTVWTIEDITVEHEATVAMREAKEQAEAAEARLRESYGELEEANQRLLQLDKLKSDFLSSVSHELRTPLTSIRGFATLIEREFSRSFVSLAGDDANLRKKSRRICDNLEIILKESDRLTRLINDVLDLAKIEAGRIEWHDALIRVETLLHDTANAAEGMFQHKPAVRLCLDIQEGLPDCMGDADRLQQVLINLMSNAAKFTERGTVTLRGWLNDEGQIQIEVRDTGIGFPQEDAEAIFDKFQQSNHGDTLADRPKGTGLGLAISREIVERHGGRIWATSASGQGSVFALTLPAVQGDTQASTARADVSVEKMPQPDNTVEIAAEARTVLVVDDDVGIRSYLTQLLQEQGYTVVAVGDGQSAITSAKTHRPSLITMDLDMPVLDGKTTIHRLRADPELQSIPIMVISAIPGWDSAGGDLAMGKPLDEPRFLANVAILLASERHGISRSLDFLVLHETGHPPAMVPGNFTANCNVEFCELDTYRERIKSGFQGMVVIPPHLLEQVDIGLLQGTPSLEVMIMPLESRPTKTVSTR